MLPDDLDSISELEKIDNQNKENIEKNLENMKKNDIKNKEYEVGDADVGNSRPEDEGTEKDISEDKQANTKPTSRNI